MRRPSLLATFVALISLMIPASAQSITNYSHYFIAGESIVTLYQSMIRRGPHVGSGKAFASVRMEPKVSATTKSTQGSCRIDQFKIDMTFTIVLPQLNSLESVNDDVRNSFGRFYEFAKKHEETHRAIWLKCASETEAIVLQVKAQSCAETETQSLKLVEEMASQCDARHAAFDISERARLANHPFMSAVRLATRSLLVAQ